MPPLPARAELRPFWSHPRGLKFYQGDVREVLAKLPAGSVHCCVTSPPYWGLRSYLPDGHEHKAFELGAEPSPDCGSRGQAQCGACFVCNLVGVFRHVRRVLRDDGTCWLNLGDTYSGGGGGNYGTGKNARYGNNTYLTNVHNRNPPLPPGNLVGVPWRVALALQADGWVLRQDVIWHKPCLSGGTILYARTQKGEMPVMLKDLVRLDPATVQLWNGTQWTQVVGFKETSPRLSPELRRIESSARRRAKYEGKEFAIVGDLEIEFRNGERVGCTREHLWPTERGILRADQLAVGDVVDCASLPQKDPPLCPSRLDDEEVGWAVGFYLAEGHTAGDKVGFAVHVKEEASAYARLKRLAESLGDSATFRRVEGNSGTVSVHGRLFTALMNEYVSGDTCYVKRLTSKAWQRSNAFLRAVAQGYLDGDGGKTTVEGRWRLGFCNNDGLAIDLRVMAARLNCRVRLKRCKHRTGSKSFPGWRGEWRFNTPCVGSSQGEVIAVRASRARKFWDIEVADAPNVFCLGSGIVTHNSPMPESVRDRCTKAHEYVFLLAKGKGYFYDQEAVKEPSSDPESHKGRKRRSPDPIASFDPGYDGHRTRVRDREGESYPTKNKRDVWAADSPDGVLAWLGEHHPEVLDDYLDAAGGKGSVWRVTAKGYKGAHYAVFPAKLVEPMILAGTSAHGCCARCGSPYRRVTAREKLRRERPNEHVKYAVDDTRNSCGNGVAGVKVETLGWEATCGCVGDGVKPCTVLDPFLGSGTVAEVCVRHGRHCVGIELNETYLSENAIPRAQAALGEFSGRKGG